MAVDLGELLVSHGLISDSQLQEGLLAQEQWGGRLITNLLELGHVTDLALATLVSEELGLPSAKPSDFEEIPPAVLRLLPRSMIEKHRIVPLSRTEDNLSLAIVDPTDLAVIKEICHATKCTVMPVLSSETLLLYGMERCYGIPRGSRYLYLTGAAPCPFIAEQRPWEACDVSSEFFAIDRSDLKEKGYSVKSAAADLSRVHRQQDIFEVMRRLVRVYFEQMAVFVFREANVVGCTQSGCRLSDHAMRQLSFPAAESELFAGGGRSPYLGKATENELDTLMFRALGISTERDLLFLPVLVNERPIAVIVASGPLRGQIADRVLLFDTFATNASYAFRILQLKQRILGSAGL